MWPMKRSTPLQSYMNNYKQRQCSELAESTYVMSDKVEISERIKISFDKIEMSKFNCKTCRWNGDKGKKLEYGKMTKVEISCRIWVFYCSCISTLWTEYTSKKEHPCLSLDLWKDFKSLVGGTKLTIITRSSFLDKVELISFHGSS